MPKISSGVSAYNQNRQLPLGQTLHGGRGTDYNSANQLLTDYWAVQPHTNQYDWDVAAWYGAHQSDGCVQNSRRALLSKLFTVMELAGVMYDNGTVSGTYQWRDCATQGIPLGSILAHGGRMLIQLPMRLAHDDAGTDFFNWLTLEARAAGTLLDRTAATHALSHRSPSIPFHGVRRFRIAEERGKLTGIRASIKTKRGERNHFGVNLPLFGDGNTNWFSGNRVDANGGHGHLYIYFNPKDVGQCGGIMVGGENSGVGAMSQTFVGHDWRAKSEKFSPAGTYKWPDMDHGPNHMIEEFVVDLSDGWDWVQGLEAFFDPTHLDYTPVPVSAGYRQIDPHRIVAHALIDLLDQPGRFSSSAKKRVQAQLDIILNAANLPRAALQNILRECYAALGTPVVQNAVSGLITPSAPITVAVPQPMRDFITASTTHWNRSV